MLRALAGIEHLTLEDRDAVLAALEAFDKGLDFADALHLAIDAYVAADSSRAQAPVVIARSKVIA